MRICLGARVAVQLATLTASLAANGATLRPVTGAVGDRRAAFDIPCARSPHLALSYVHAYPAPRYFTCRLFCVIAVVVLQSSVGFSITCIKSIVRVLRSVCCMSAGGRQEQVRTGGAQSWVRDVDSGIALHRADFGVDAFSCQDYCSPRVNYADVRARVAHAFAAKASELGDAIALVQGLSKESVALLDQIRIYCGSA